MIKQVRATDPDTGLRFIYQYDIDKGEVVLRFNADANKWESSFEGGWSIFVTDIEDLLGPTEKQAIAQNLAESGLFKPKTEYIFIGDEPTGGSGVVNLASLLSASEIEDLKKFLTLMPRQMFREWFMLKVWPSLPADYNQMVYQTTDPIYGTTQRRKNYEDLVWAAFIDIFNQANLKYCNDNQLEPWTWEQEKLNAYYVSKNKDALDQLEAQVDSLKDVNLGLDPEANKVMEAYARLSPLGDIGLEINRQNAIKELLRAKDYTVAQAIVDAYRYAEETVIGPSLVEPVPFNIADESGTLLIKAT